MRLLTLVALLTSAGMVNADIQLVSDKQLEFFRQSLPEIDEPVASVLADPNVIFYDISVIPPAYQFWNRGFSGLHSPAYNISGGADFAGRGNANREFPWHKPGGTRVGDGTRSAKFLLLPRQPNSDEPWPVVWFQPNALIGWVFPKDTVIGEVLYLQHGDEWLVFEIRTRTREINDWAVDVFRPFPSQASLVQALISKGEVELADQIANGRGQTYRVTSGRLSNAFSQSATMQVLPRIPQEIATQLLKETKFTSAVGDEWTPEIDAATTAQVASIVPPNYTAAHLGNDRVGCANCHKDTAVRAVTFNRPREWYGRVRGNDGIFSFHPFTRGSISPNGVSRPVRIREDFKRAGVVEKFNGARHPNTVYQRTRFTRS